MGAYVIYEWPYMLMQMETTEPSHTKQSVLVARRYRLLLDVRHLSLHPADALRSAVRDVTEMCLQAGESG